MKRERHSFPTGNPELEVVRTDDGSHTLRFSDRPVTWHSESGAIAESKLVFLENSGTGRRMEMGTPTSVFEVGFGTGLNFWLTATKAMLHQSALKYTSVEPKRFDYETIRQLGYDQLPDCREAFVEFSARVFQRHPTPVEISHGNVNLRLIHGKLNEIIWKNLEPFDAVYFDPFDPDEAPDLWTPSVFHQMFEILCGGGRLVTYCVKSRIQKILVEVGFELTKTRGPKRGKREVLIAIRPESR